MAEAINFNQAILSNYQKIYPNLMDFSYDIESDSLVFESQRAKLNGYGLSRIDPIFFDMAAEDIFSYFKNGFYQNSKDSDQINVLFDQMVLTEEHLDYLKRFAEIFNERCNIYLRNKEFFDKNCETNENVRTFGEELIKGRKVINYAQKNAIPNELNAASILNEAYENTIMKNNIGEDNSKKMSLTRFKPGFIGFDEEEYLKEKQKLGVAGFTSIILIISSVVVFGVYLALKIMP